LSRPYCKVRNVKKKQTNKKKHPHTTKRKFKIFLNKKKEENFKIKNRK